MAIFAAFSETESLDVVGANTINVTTGGAVVAGVNRAAIQLAARNVGIATLTTPIAEGWLHARIVPRQASTSNSLSNVDYILSIRDTNGTIIGGFYQNDNNSFGMDWWATYFGDPNIGTANSTTTGTLIGVPSGGYDVDLHFRISDTDGFLRWYVGGSLVREFLGDTKPSAATQVGSVRAAACGTSGGTDSANRIEISQVIVSDLPTIGARLHTLPLSAGSVNQWGGTVADINAADETRSTLMFEDTAGDQALFAAGDVASINAGNRIAAVVMATSSLVMAGAGVTKQRGRARIGGTDYTIGADATLTAAFAPTRHIAEVNPATGVAWTLAEVNAAEFGLQAIA